MSLKYTAAGKGTTGIDMVRSSKGTRKGARRLLKKELRAKFKPEMFIKEFKPGDRVIIKIEPSSRKSMIHPRYQGKMGTVEGKRGSAYIVGTRLGGKKKQIQVSPEHLKSDKY